MTHYIYKFLLEMIFYFYFVKFYDLNFSRLPLYNIMKSATPANHVFLKGSIRTHEGTVHPSV